MKMTVKELKNYFNSIPNTVDDAEIVVGGCDQSFFLQKDGFELIPPSSQHAKPILLITDGKTMAFLPK